MALSPDELAAGDLLLMDNARPISATNPYGLGQGGQRNYLAVAAGLSLFGAAIARESQGDRTAGAASAAGDIYATVTQVFEEAAP